ncbi:hypothetical protein A3K73_04035 [Candidatus Pacearchaeota archaeon RBG_13_36_9]|nr:MAG: hypothetical protein A3K73_04035 [Candidatus Pacearchaeota archaeon RBG_13_36_9]
MDKSLILGILNDWNYWKKDLPAGIARHFFSEKISQKAKTMEIIVIKGIRRCGKSTLLSQYCQNLIDGGVNKEDILIVNFEDPRFIGLDLDALNKIYEIYLTEFNPSKKHYVILDEVQVVAAWEKFARFLHENKKINVLVTGSNSKLLSSDYATVITGRHLDIQAYPLSFREFLIFNKIDISDELDKISKRHVIQRNLKEFMKWGGFPKVTLTVREDDKVDLLKNYFRDILIKDIAARYKIKELQKLEELAKYYLTNISTLSSVNKISKILDISLGTAERFSGYLSDSYMISFIPKFSWKKKEQIINPKKVYCADIGLRNSVSFLFKEDYGRIAENIVYNHLYSKENEIFYWKGKQECDFIVKNGLKKYRAIQACWNISKPETKERELKGLAEACKELKLKEGLIITEDLENEETVEGIKIKYIPLWKWLLENKT